MGCNVGLEGEGGVFVDLELVYHVRRYDVGVARDFFKWNHVNRLLSSCLLVVVGIFIEGRTDHLVPHVS